MNASAARVGKGRVFFAALSLLAGAAGLTAVPSALAETKASKSASAVVDSKAPDKVILKSGKIVTGRVLEETPDQVVMMVVINGIEAKTSYPRAEVLEVKLNANLAAADKAGKGDETIEEAAEEAVSDEPATDDEAAASEDDPTLTRLYVVELKGNFGEEVSETPITRMFVEADRFFNDLIPGTGELAGKKVVDPAKRERNVIVIKLDLKSNAGPGSLLQSEHEAQMLTEQIFEKGRRTVFWVENSLGGAGFIPFLSPEIYFVSDGTMGGVGDYDRFNSGDKMVNEKLISAYLGHAKGMVNRGGYTDHLPVVDAMFRTQNWLAVRFEGGKPIYLDRKPDPAKDGEGWVILSDDGKGDNKDKSAIKGNDLLALDAEWAERLGISRGTVDTIDDLAFKLGVQSHYKAIEENRAQKAVKEWSDRLEDAIRNVNNQQNRPLGKLWREFEDAGRPGGNADARKVLGNQLRILRQIRAIVAQFKESLDPGGSWIPELDFRISNLQLEIEQANRNERDRRSNNGGR